MVSHKPNLLCLGTPEDSFILDALESSSEFAHVVILVASAGDLSRLRVRFGAYPSISLRALNTENLHAAFTDPQYANADWACAVAREGAPHRTDTVVTRKCNFLADEADFRITRRVDAIRIVTAANDAFRWWYDQLAYSVGILRYPIEIYDLGSLGFGIPHQTEVPLRPDGYYTVVDAKWKSKALHKPDVIADFIRRRIGFTVYLDADIVVDQAIDEVTQAANGAYDVGVTVRSALEMMKTSTKGNWKYTGYLNAGVAFFQPTTAATEFVRRWQMKTRELGNDQMALNALVNPEGREITAGETLVEDGCRIHLFPGEVYNFDYQLESELTGSEKILHFKNSKDRLLHFEEVRSERNERTLLDELAAAVPEDWDKREIFLRQFAMLRAEGRRLRAQLVKERGKWSKQRTRLHSLVDSLKSTLLEGAE